MVRSDSPNLSLRIWSSHLLHRHRGCSHYFEERTALGDEKFTRMEPIRTGKYMGGGGRSATADTKTHCQLPHRCWLVGWFSVVDWVSEWSLDGVASDEALLFFVEQSLKWTFVTTTITNSQTNTTIVIVIDATVRACYLYVWSLFRI
jgi:hypothetical protein